MAINEAIIASPFDVWTAPVGEAMPTVDAAPSGNWALIGSQVDQLTQDESGVSLSNTQSITDIRGAGSTAPIKAVRSEEDLLVSINMMDMTFEVLDFALRGGGVTEVSAVSGVIGTKSIPIWRGTQVVEHALLLRGPSPYLVDTNMQFEFYRVYAAGDLDQSYAKATAVVVNIQFKVLMDLTQSSPFYMGRVIAQHEAALA